MGSSDLFFGEASADGATTPAITNNADKTHLMFILFSICGLFEAFGGTVLIIYSYYLYVYLLYVDEYE
jgi:hypothetical protein